MVPEPAAVPENFWYQKSLYKKETAFWTKFFCPTVPKKNVDCTFGVCDYFPMLVLDCICKIGNTLSQGNFRGKRGQSAEILKNKTETDRKCESVD